MTIQGWCASFFLGTVVAACGAGQQPSANTPPAKSSLQRFDASVIGDGVIAGDVNCPPACSTGFSAGKTVRLRAVPSAGSRFVSWTGAACTTDACQIVVTGQTTIAARFEPVPVPVQGFVDVSVAVQGNGAVEVNGEQCGPACAVRVPRGSAIVLHALPGHDSFLQGWNGIGCRQAVCVVNADGDVKATAVIADQPQLACAGLSDGAACQSPCGAGICSAGVCQGPALQPAWTYDPAPDTFLWFGGLADVAGNSYWLEWPNHNPARCSYVSATAAGTVRFRADWGCSRGLPLLTGDILVATTFDKAWAVRGFDAGDGATRWTHAVGPEFASSAGTLPAAITITGMAADDRAIYFTAHTAEVIPSSMLTAWLVALDPSDGHVLWTRQRDGVSGGVITDGAGNVFADLILRSGPEGYGDFRMSALSASGSELWLASNYDGEGTGDPIAVASGLVFPRGDRDAPVHLVDGGDLAYVAPYTPYGPTFAPVFGDNTGFVESVHTSMPFPGDKRAGNTLTTFDLLTGAAIAAVDLSDVPDTDGTEPLVTSRQEILIGTSSPDGASGSTSTLRAFRRDGTVDFACPVDLPEPFTAGGPSPSALVAGTWIVQTGDASMLGHSRLWGFRVPGLELASTGWPVAQGSMQRRNAPPTK